LLVAVDPIKLSQLGVDPDEVPPRAALVDGAVRSVQRAAAEVLAAL
jgi:hypothetical protein